MFKNLFGNYRSFHARSIGIVPSGNYGDDIALFEPILSGAMLLDYLNLNGQIIWEAVKSYVRKGNLTPDLGGTAMTKDVVEGIIGKIEY